MICGGLNALALNARPVIRAGLQTYYTFEKQTISGSSLANQTATSRTGAINNSPSVAQGYNGQCMGFTAASSQYVLAGDNSYEGNNSPWTTVLIVKATHDSNNNALEQPASKPSTSIFSWDHPNGAFNQAWAIHTSDGWFSAKYNTLLKANTWYTLIGTYDGSYLRAYLGDSLETATPVSNATFDYNQYWIGCGYNFGASNFFDGWVDEYRYYNRVLSAGERSAIARLRG
jgi:hypothetical protein